MYKVLRYLLLYAIYLLFSKDWKSLSQMVLVTKVHLGKWGLLYCLIRLVFILLNELVIFAVVVCTNIGEDRAMGLIVNFSAAIIICELDDIIMKTGRI